MYEVVKFYTLVKWRFQKSIVTYNCNKYVYIRSHDLSKLSKRTHSKCHLTLMNVLGPTSALHDPV